MQQECSESAQEQRVALYKCNLPTNFVKTRRYSLFLYYSVLYGGRASGQILQLSPTDKLYAGDYQAMWDLA